MTDSGSLAERYATMKDAPWFKEAHEGKSLGERMPLPEEGPELKPLHVRVAEALGWSHIGPGNSMNMGDPGIGYPPSAPIVGHKVEIPRFDTDWSATGPLIEKYWITTGATVTWDSGNQAPRVRHWSAWTDYPEIRIDGVDGWTPLIAVCHLILAIKEAGKL